MFVALREEMRELGMNEASCEKLNHYGNALPNEPGNKLGRGLVNSFSLSFKNTDSRLDPGAVLIKGSMSEVKKTYHG
jgi:hypothetical protein